MHTDGSLVEFARRSEQWFTSADNAWSRQQQGRTLCRRCLRLDRRTFPAPLDLVLRQLPEGTSYSAVFYGGAAVIREDLLTALEKHLSGFAIGRCFWFTGEEIPGYRSIYSDVIIPLRVVPTGRSDMETCVACPECGQWEGSSNHRYVIRSEVPQRAVLQSSISCLYLSDTVAQSLDWSRFPDAVPRKVAIREERLPGDPCP